MFLADEAELQVVGLLGVYFFQHHLEDLLVAVLQDGSEDFGVYEVEDGALEEDHDFLLIRHDAVLDALQHHGVLVPLGLPHQVKPQVHQGGVLLPTDPQLFFLR